MVGGTECALVLAGLVRTVMDWLFEITRCSSGLLELFIPVVLGRLISRARSVAIGWEADLPSIRALRLRVTGIFSLSPEDEKGMQMGNIVIKLEA
jgi:hypothetical protein